MRWSAVFEEFTTYYHAARPRRAPENVGWEGARVRLIWKEFEYIPDFGCRGDDLGSRKPLVEDEILGLGPQGGQLEPCRTGDR